MVHLMRMGIYILVQGSRRKLTVGHALNKILKDIILRYNILQGRKVSYIPGWDCHGLPIELKAVKTKPGKYLSAPKIRQIARSFAEKTVLKQMDGFKGWAVIGDWEKRWCTMGIYLYERS
jgi:isoleucyl-tRNA synthetase